MINNRILQYIQKSLLRGYSTEEIREALLAQKWELDEINEALERGKEELLHKPPISPAPSKNSIFDFELSAAHILLHLGQLIILLAGVIYSVSNWQTWNMFLRIFIVLIPIIICYSKGLKLQHSTLKDKQGSVFLVTGSLLIPLFISILFQEFKFLEPPFSNKFSFVLLLLSSILYFYSYSIFHFPVWTFLFQITGSLSYLFLLDIIGIDGITVSWLFLIPGTLCIYLSIFYNKNKKYIESSYSYVIGIFISFLSLFVIMKDAFFFNKEHYSYIFIVFGIAVFYLGLFYEKNNLKKYCELPYLGSTAIVFCSLDRIGTNTTLFEDILRSPILANSFLDSFSNLLIGIVFLLIAAKMKKLQSLNFKKALKYKEFFNFVGPIWVLGSIFSLCTNEKNFFYETLLLVTSLGFIFGSIPKSSRKFLYIGTLFFVFYIFLIWYRYFDYNASWPITLFIAGIISMSISLGIEKIKKQLLSQKNPNSD